ncbi:MAG: asparagine synthase, partial [Bacteroidales bacterium]|nr:asparagine synthase [Bacteroidales bacterium]
KYWLKLKNCAPNIKYLSKCLSYGIPETNDGLSPFNSIYQVKSGGYIEISFIGKRLVIKEGIYYNLVEQVNSKINIVKEKSYTQLKNELFELFHSSILLRLRSDVPVGLSISGGFDSISIGSIASQLYSNIVGFHYGDPAKKESEGPLVKEFQDKRNIEIHYIWPHKDEILSSFNDTVLAQEAPFTSFSIIAQQLVYKKAKEESIKVLLGGQGGDEVLMGYRKYQFFYLQKLLHEKKFLKLGSNLTGFLFMVFSEIEKFRLYLDQSNRYNKNGQEYSLILPQAESIELNIDKTKPLWQRQIIDVNVSSLPTLLQYEDRNSMYNSIESRLPFMDYRLVEFGMALPETFKDKNGYGKWIMRDIMKDQIPERIRLNREKRGFDGQNHWIGLGIGDKIRGELKQRLDIINKFLPPKIDIDTYFCNNAMKFPNLRLREFLILYWLSLELDR